MASPQQFYIMHCAKPDSVLGAAGFSVRAASTFDPVLLRSALDLPAYELPMDMWAKKPSRKETPRRLARLGDWVVHSSYLEKDTTNRDRSFFTHALWMPSSDPLAVLKTWGSSQWATNCEPGESQTLPEPTPLVVGSLLSDAAVTAFLTGEVEERTLHKQILPNRLNPEPAFRQLLLAQFLLAIQKVKGEREGGRNRVYVHAEPGLVAQLLYAAVRLLTPNLTADLTFSTFEPTHRGLREFKLATVVGTYLGHPGKWLEPEFTTVRGYGIDTFHTNRTSPDLAKPPAEFLEIVALAVAGDWKTLDLRQSINFEPERGAELLSEYLKQPRGTIETLSAPARRWLRVECAKAFTALPKEVVPLLRAKDEADAEAIFTDFKLPAAWRATAILVLLRKSESREVPQVLKAKAHQLLKNARPDVLALFFGSAVDNAEKHPELWAELLAAMSETVLFDRLAEAGEAMPSKRWKAFLDRCPNFEATGPRHLRLLGLFGAALEGHGLWREAVAKLDDRFLKGDNGQAADWDTLARAMASLRGTEVGLPMEVREKIASGHLLRAVLANAASAQGISATDFHRAFRVLGYAQPVDALAWIYTKVFPGVLPDSDAGRFAHFFGLFLACYPVDPASFPGMNVPLDVWLKLSEFCPDPGRDPFQSHFLRHAIPPDRRESILAQNANPALRPHLRAALLQEVRPTVTPENPFEESEVDELPDEEESLPTKRRKVKPKKSMAVPIALLIGLVAVVSILGIVAAYQFGLLK